jgi:SSS family solute:Na+ symporter
MERAVTISAILSGGTLGLFMLGFLTRRATRQGCYIGIAACLLFTAWGVLTSGTHETRIVDMPINFTMNSILIGVFGHIILFVVGYVASLVIGGYRPADVERLTFRWNRNEK